MKPACKAHVLLTGATGFVGKVVLEELTRRRNELGIESVYVLLRNKKAARTGKARSVQERFTAEIAGSGCFSRRSDDWQRICKVVEGELTQNDCGLSAKDVAMLASRVTHVIHCAASVEFDLPLAESAEANITTGLHALALAKRCARLKSMIAVSTAYVTPHVSDGTPIREVLAPLPRPADELYRDIFDGNADEKALLRQTGHPNTYTFTKCVTEHLLMHRKGRVPLTLIRPSIIAACVQHPFPAWIDSAAGYAGFVALIGAGHLRAVVADNRSRLDIVPCDVVSNLIVESAFACDRVPTRGATIRHAIAGIGSSCRIDEHIERIVDFFQSHPVDRAPGLEYVGPMSREFRLHEMRLHRVPAGLATSWFSVSRQPRMHRAAARVADRLRYLNRAFPYFTQKTFDFRTSRALPAPTSRRAYVDLVCLGVYRHLIKRDETAMSLAGREHKKKNDVLWSIRQSSGNWAIRSFAVAVRKALRSCASHVTFDYASFAAAVAASPGGRHVVVPTHRSYMDFLLCSYLFFARPDLGISIPHIAAAEEFGRIPILGSLFRKTHAFYLKRGLGAPDKQLTATVHALVAQGKTLEFFIEGARSRSRRFLPPRHGLLRCLQETGETFSLLPVAITYDRVPEEASLLRELRGSSKVPMQLRALFALARRLANGDVSLGRIHMTCGAPVSMRPESDVRDVSRRVMAELQRNTATSTYHLRSFLAKNEIAGVDSSWLRDSIRRRGGVVIDSELETEAVDAVAEECMRNHWRHVFFPEVLALWPEHPAIVHHVRTNGYVPSDRIPDDAELSDPRLRDLLHALFAPVVRDYAITAEKLGRTDWQPRHASARGVLFEASAAHLPNVQAVFADLVDRKILALDVEGRHVWGPYASALAAWKLACTPLTKPGGPTWHRAMGA